MRHKHFSVMRSFVLAATVGMGCSAQATAALLPVVEVFDSGQVVEMPIFPLMPNLRLDLLASTLSVGCTWIRGADSEAKNIGYPDTQAGYFIVSLPINPGPGVTYTITGGFPQVRHFGFQTYDGYRPDNLIDTLPDARIAPNGGPAPAINPAVLPVRGNYGRQYAAAIKFQFPPSNAALREPNTVYAGDRSRRGALTKQLVYRTYLPNPGVDKFGAAPLPVIVYHGPLGDIDLRDTPDQAACNSIKRRNDAITTFPVAGGSRARPVFKPVSARGTLALYPNADITYMIAQPGRRRGDMVLIRAKAPLVPRLPTEQIVPNPQTRYWSLCHNELNTSKVVACLADREMTLQADGYMYAVISPPERRHPMARTEFGYNWLPFGNGENGLVGFRQLLADPTFVGNYARAAAQPNLPLATTLGEWAPDITYCDQATFGALAGVNGATAFAGCKAASQ
ncbi:MAG: hypothetical protein ACT4QA_13380 [Panacagrimonas sp.]